ncbi:hypothetical protein SCUCBS95973_000817 [Sporothrix curviconia]|uniref:TRIP4/RQT4 C2HC5-type zinc finger domain-containing protein n=1 Tax=Sporothrix curviconia TaxID=1260050 RepID=A0ABP0ATG4_9PEZI
MSKAQLGRLIDLPDDDLQQVLDYATTLSKAATAEHFANLLGDSPAAIEFVSAFNARRHDPAAGCAAAVAAPSSASPSPSGTSTPAGIEPVPKHTRTKKKKAPLHALPPRQVTSLAPPQGTVYNKKDAGGNYMGGGGGAGGGGSGRSSGATTPLAVAGAGIVRGATPVSGLAPTSTPPPQGSPKKPPPAQQQPQQKQRNGGGSLISDALAPKTKKTSPAPPSSSSSSRDTATTKISITGGTAMHGAATALADFDAAIRSLEVSTNPTLSGTASPEDAHRRRCNCVATRHPLQMAAPNCQSCGKVICVKEGLGPCTFCGSPLLSPAEVQAMIKELRAERGREKMAADREAHRRPDARGKGGGMTHAQHAAPHMIAGQTKWGGDDDGFVSLAEAAKAAENAQQTAEAKARAHRDRLLAFQAQNAQRTTVRDEAADFDVGDAMAGEDGISKNLWATPEERARELRRQQKLLREMEWNARPEYEKRQQVLSIDVTGRKVFRKTVTVDTPRPVTPDSAEERENDEYGHHGPGAAVLTDADGNKDMRDQRVANNGGAFSKNPLLGHLIKPVYDARSRAKAEEEAKKKREEEVRKKDRKEKDGKETEGKEKAKGKGKDKAEGGKDEAGSSTVPDDAPLPGRREAGSRWRRVQDDLDNNEAVILDGGIYGAGVPNTLPVGDEPECS